MDAPTVLTIAIFCLTIFVLSLAISAAVRRIPVLDTPNNRSSHQRPIPRIGGVAIVGPFLLGLLALALMTVSSFELEWTGAGFAVSCLLIAITGLLDDLGRLRAPTHKLLLQCLVSLVLVLSGVWLREIPLPLFGTVELGWFGPIITVFWLVAVTNAVNFMDGLDGLAAGTCAIAALFFAGVIYSAGATGWGLACALLVPAILGFLPFNFPRASLFMGDVGSQFLGFSLAGFAVIAAQQPGAETSALVMPLLLFHFLFDTLFTLVRRTLAGERVSQAHRSHLYQLVNRLGWSHFRVSTLHFALTALQGVGAIILCRVSPEHRVIVFLPFLVLEVTYAVIVMRLAGQHGLLLESGRVSG